MYDPYNSVVPIFIERKNTYAIEQIASSVYVSNQLGNFLFTAAHVTDDLLHGRLLIPIENYLTEVDGYISYVDLLPEETRQKDMVDSAYIKLSAMQDRNLSKNYSPIKGENTLISDELKELTTCTVVGYPVTKSKNTNDRYSSEIYSYTGTKLLIEEANQLNLHNENNIAIWFNRKKVVNPATEKIYTAPSLKGVSGGGIFGWPSDKPYDCEWNERKLIGIFHTYKERDKIMIGTTLTSFLGALTLGELKGFGGY